jgi:hypothetical protein
VLSGAGLKVYYKDRVNRLETSGNGGLREKEMGTELKLAVNDIQIKTDYFVKEFTEHTAIGMMGGLRDTGEVKELMLAIQNGAVTININGRAIPVNAYATKIIITTTEGLLKPLKGVTFPIKKVDLYIKK